MRALIPLALLFSVAGCQISQGPSPDRLSSSSESARSAPLLPQTVQETLPESRAYFTSSAPPADAPQEQFEHWARVYDSITYGGVRFPAHRPRFDSVGVESVLYVNPSVVTDARDAIATPADVATFGLRTLRSQGREVGYRGYDYMDAILDLRHDATRQWVLQEILAEVREYRPNGLFLDDMNPGHDVPRKIVLANTSSTSVPLGWTETDKLAWTQALVDLTNRLEAALSLPLSLNPGGAGQTYVDGYDYLQLYNGPWSDWTMILESAYEGDLTSNRITLNGPRSLSRHRAMLSPVWVTWTITPEHARSQNIRWTIWWTSLLAMNPDVDGHMIGWLVTRGVDPSDPAQRYLPDVLDALENEQTILRSWGALSSTTLPSSQTGSAVLEWERGVRVTVPLSSPFAFTVEPPDALDAPLPPPVSEEEMLRRRVEVLETEVADLQNALTHTENELISTQASLEASVAETSSLQSRILRAREALAP